MSFFLPLKELYNILKPDFSYLYRGMFHTSERYLLEGPEIGKQEKGFATKTQGKFKYVQILFGTEENIPERIQERPN